MEPAVLPGEKIQLKPATPSDKRMVFEWLTNSNLTQDMLGWPHYPETKIPTWEEFDEDYVDHYFDDSAPQSGRCFIIWYNDTAIGQINYNAIDPVTKRTDLDIWLSDAKYTGKGLGTEAIQLLCAYLQQAFGCEQILICPSLRNRRAIAAYEKAGFVLTNLALEDTAKEYADQVVLLKYLASSAEAVKKGKIPPAQPGD